MITAARIPVILLTGGLGSGKTTLLAAWLGQPELQKAALIVNEIGEVGLDDRLLRPSLQASDTAALVANACICCSGLPGLEEALADLYRARLERRIERFDCVVIETTGLAQPQPVVEAFRRDPLLRERYELAGVISTVSATAAQALDTREELQAQVRGADLLVITKADRVDPVQLAALAARLQAANPAAAVVRSAQADLPAAQALDLLARRARVPVAAAPVEAAPVLVPSGGASPDHSHDHAHGHVQGHANGGSHHHHAEARFVPWPVPVGRAALLRRLRQGIAGSSGLLRLKGAVMADDGLAVAVQWSPGDEAPVLAPLAGPLAAPGLTVIATDAAAAQALADRLAG